MLLDRPNKLSRRRCQASPIGALKQGLVVVCKPGEVSKRPLPRKFGWLRPVEQKGWVAEIGEGIPENLASQRVKDNGKSSMRGMRIASECSHADQRVAGSDHPKGVVRLHREV